VKEIIGLYESGKISSVDTAINAITGLRKGGEKAEKIYSKLKLKYAKDEPLAARMKKTRLRNKTKDNKKYDITGHIYMTNNYMSVNHKTGVRRPFTREEDYPYVQTIIARTKEEAIK
jgi:hypothetical protein